MLYGNCAAPSSVVLMSQRKFSLINYIYSLKVITQVNPNVLSIPSLPYLPYPTIPVDQACLYQNTNAIYTSVKIIQLNEYGCRDAPCEKSWKQGNPLSNTIKDTSTIMRNPLSELCREGYA